MRAERGEPARGTPARPAAPGAEISAFHRIPGVDMALQLGPELVNTRREMTPRPEPRPQIVNRSRREEQGRFVIGDGDGHHLALS